MTSSAIAHANPYRYRGYRYDEESGYYYLNARYYNPEIGRFISADPLLRASDTVLGHNMFAYTENNPVMYTDFSGNGACYADINVNDSNGPTCIGPSGSGSRSSYISTLISTFQDYTHVNFQRYEYSSYTYISVIDGYKVDVHVYNTEDMVWVKINTETSLGLLGTKGGIEKLASAIYWAILYRDWQMPFSYHRLEGEIALHYIFYMQSIATDSTSTMDIGNETGIRTFTDPLAGGFIGLLFY